MTLPYYVGRFEVRNEIAQGGFAVVLRAWDEELECFVALKIMPPRLAENKEFQRRFLEEARLLRRIRSPNVVTVHDVGRLNDGRPYFVMDFADRGTLEPRLERPAGTPEPEAQNVMALTDALADGLAAIHEAGVIHRDIKPANILFQLARRGTVDRELPSTESTETHSSLVSIDERILISDLGIAKDLVKHTAAATLVGGTPLYQAPEQADPRAKITPAVDVYAASAMLWHVLTGESPPAVGGIKSRLAGLPEAWRALLEQGMAPAPEDRFDTIESWRAAVHDTLALNSAAQQVDLPTQVAAVDESCPYKGLAAYQPEDARFFHGREALIDEIARRLQLNRVLVVGGPSGSGKSSLVRAGLIPALKAGAIPGSDAWGVALFTPGRDPLAELYFHITRRSASGKPLVALEDVVNYPAMARHLGDVTGAGQPLVLCIDQAEEIFTLTSSARRDKFISALSAMADPADSLVRVVFTIRADFYGNCAQIPWLADRITNNQVLVGPMTDAELRRAISEPARPAGLYLERGLVDAIIAEAGNEAGSLPLVAHALVETWLRRTGNKLTLEGFQAAGGVAGAISQSVEAIYDNRFDSSQREATKRLFLRLVTPGEGTPDTRRIISRSELERAADPAVMHRVVETLTEARLLTVDDASVQIAHEALLRTWPRLRTWIEESRDELRTRLRISRAAAEWDAEGRDADLLYRGTPMLSALEWAERYPDQLGRLERDFLDASAETKARAEAVAAERKRRNRRVRRVTVAVLSVLALGTSMASIVAFTALREARLNERRAETATAEAHERFAGALGAVANGLVDADPLLALFLGTEAVVRAETNPPGYDARAAMLAARRALSRDGPFLAGSPVAAGDALSIAMRGDGTMVASAQRNGAIDLIDTATGRRVGASLRGHRGGVRDVDFSPDGRRLASVGADGTVRLWNIGEGAGGRGKLIGEAKDVVMAVCFGPDGKTVAAGNGDGSVQLWDAVREAPMGGPLIKLALGFNAIEFSPDGRGLVASIHDGTIYGWSLPSRAPLFEPISGVHTSHLLELAISPGGDRIATASTDGTSMVLEYPGGGIVGPAFGADYQIGAVAFTPDGRILIGGNDSGGLSLWDVARQKQLGTTPSGHSQGIVDAELSEDGRLLATLGRDQVIRFWSFDSNYPLANERQVVGRAAKGLAFSANGEYLAAGDDTGMVQVWVRGSGRTPIVLQAHQHQVWALAFSPDGKLLASGDRSGQVRLWNMPEATQQRVFVAHDSAIWSLAFTPDGNHLITAGDGDACLWDAGTGQLQARLAHDAGRITRAVLSPDGARLAVTSTEGDIRIWDLKREAVLRDIKADDDVIWSAAFSPDSRLLAAASSDEVVTLWDLADGRQQGTYTGHTGGATDLAFLADRVTLVVVDRSGMLHWWDTRTGRRLSKAWQAHAGTSWRLAVHPDGQRFVTAGDDGKVKIWDELSVARACQISQRVFDDLRRRQYLGQDERSLACE
ncbi:High-affnity carbon uptake protein Hat/HatR [Olavius algarvensis Delta 1 endosymbiont]|nr:High-affnity carbon uptake protein Hat/HatR [Olavius algarvensis Delta 1 endosymbiont]